MRFGNVPAPTAPENQRARPALLVDAGPLITLAYANALDLLLRPGWPLRMVDMVLHELTRRDTPTRERIRNFVEGNGIPVMPTQTWQMYQLRVQRAAGSGLPPPRKASLHLPCRFLRSLPYSFSKITALHGQDSCFPRVP